MERPSPVSSVWNNAGSIHGEKQDLISKSLVGRGHCSCSEVGVGSGGDTGLALWLGGPAGWDPHTIRAIG